MRVCVCVCHCSCVCGIVRVSAECPDCVLDHRPASQLSTENEPGVWGCAFPFEQHASGAALPQTLVKASSGALRGQEARAGRPRACSTFSGL